MKPSQCLTAYHRAYVKRMKRAAMQRSKRPAMSPVEFMAQVQRLRQSGLRGKSATSN